MIEKPGNHHSPEEINPYDSTQTKGRQVERMFDSIAPAYNIMNTMMSFGMHKLWLRKSIAAAAKALTVKPQTIVDIATGTGEVAFFMSEKFPEASVIGIDLSEGMLDVAKKKLSVLGENTEKRISFRVGDCLDLDIPDNSADLITVFYGVRNFENLKKGYSEIYRVLKKGGVLCVTELARPASALVRPFYDIYANCLIPAVGRLVSGDARAYSYLPESIAACPQRNEMTDMMRNAGFSQCSFRPMTLGTVICYIARK